MDITRIIEILACAIAILFVFVPHEFAHAATAHLCGDITPKLNGRLTLNPVKHLDPFGYILCVFAGFGWAKPVPINPNNFKHFRRGLFFTSIAGVIANYFVSFLVYPLALLILNYFVITAESDAIYYLSLFFFYVFYQVYAVGLCLFVFNLLPFYPLDGFRVVEAFTRSTNPVQRFLRNYGYYILMFLLFESIVCRYAYDFTGIELLSQMDILGWVISFSTTYLGWPISAFWGLII